MDTSMFDLSLTDAELMALITQAPPEMSWSKTTLMELLEPSEIGQDPDPARYVRLFRSAAGVPGVSSLIALSCAIQACNGLRRVKAADHATYRRELGELVDELRRVESGLTGRDQTCWSLLGELYYQLSLIERMRRAHASAEQYQLVSSGHFMAAGRTVDAQVALFIAAVEAASQVLAYGTEMEVDLALAHLRQMRECVRNWCAPDYPRWMVASAALHVAWAHLLGDIDYAEREQDETEARTSPASHWKALFEVVALLRANQYAEVVASADAAIAAMQTLSTSSRANTELTCQLLKARALRALGRDDEVVALLGVITAWDGEDGAVVMTAAQNELRDLA